MLNKLRKNQQGTTLLELIIYIGIITFILVIILQFSWNIIGSKVKVDVSAELNQNARLILDKITQKTHEAEDIITGSSTFDSHPGVLALDMPGSGSDITFDTYTTNVSVGTSTINIRKLRMQVGAASPIDITSDKIDITNFYLQNFTRDDKGKNINLQLTLDFVTTDDPLRDQDLSIETGISLREQ